MEKFKWTCNLLLALFILLDIVSCLYEDQVGKFDWKQNFIGNVRFGTFDSVKKLIVATEENVLASLNLRNGQIIWRQILENPNTHRIELLHVDKDIITISGTKNTWHVRGWDINGGFLLWEWTFSTENQHKAYWFIENYQLVHIVPVLRSHLEVTQYDVETGSNSNKTTKIVAPWITDLSNCITAGYYWTCVSEGKLYYLDVLTETNQVYHVPLNDLIKNFNGSAKIKSLKHLEPNLLLINEGKANYIHLKPEMPKVYDHILTEHSFIAENGSQKLILDFNAETNWYLSLLDVDEGTSSTVETEYNSDIPIAIIAAVCRGPACRILCKASDNSISLLQMPSGKVLWTREEALSHIVAVEFFELPVSELDAAMDQEFDITSNDIFSILYHRLLCQARQLLVIVTGQQGSSLTGLVRDKFGLHKVIVAVTNVGKLYALDSMTGEVVWTKFFPEVKSFHSLEKSTALLFLQRNARHTPLPAQCVLLMKDKVTGRGVLYSFDPISGLSLKGIEHLPYEIEQAMLVPFEDEDHLRGLLVRSKDGQIHLYPASTKTVLVKHAQNTYFYSANTETNKIYGYNLMHSTSEDIKVTQTWELNLGQAKLVSLSVRPPDEKVHSQGRVLPDRSVLYKYINPNLLAIGAISDDPLHKHVLSVYLVDGITGLVVFSAVHKRAGKPIHMVHSENWLIYTYYNERFRRIELASVELYEGTVQSNSTSFSSHALSQLPHPEMQAYIFPATPVAVQATLTERGITNKHILIALSNGAVTEVPWAFLEPRGALGFLNMEEGRIPYIPELTIPAEATVNYNQSVGRVRGMQVSPARLESTCLLLVYGLDLYHTRVAPSKTFDLLKEDFDHWLIVVVLVGLSVSVYMTKWLAHRKALRQAWK